MINLSKADQNATISLAKGSSDIIVRAQWVDNGDGDDGNDDLDLRCSLLAPNGKMYLIDGEYRKALQEPTGKTSAPGQEETAWIFWQDSAIDIDIVGPAVFKRPQASESEPYNKKFRIPYRFENVTSAKKKLFG